MADPIKDIDLKKYFAIVQKVQSDAEISDEEGKYLMEHVPHGEEELKALNEKIEKAKVSGIVPAELDAQAAFQAAQLFMQSPTYKSQMAKMISDADAGRLSDRLTTAFNVALAGTDVAQSISQIEQSKNLSNKSQRPGKPAPIAADQNLAQALRQAQEGTYDVSKQLAPAQAQNQDQYNEDIQNAKITSTGQAGAFGAYTQAAANRRNRAGLEQSALGSQIMQQNRANYNNLLGLKQQENQNIFNSRAYGYPYDLNQYQNEQQTAAELGRYGNVNLRNAVANLGQVGVDAAANSARARRLRMLQSAMDQYGQGEQAVAADNTLNKYTSPQSTVEAAYYGYPGGDLR